MRTLRDPFPVAPYEWHAGPQARLVEAFLARGIGDDPVSEISDADVENVSRIARLVAPEDVQHLLHLLDQLLGGRFASGDTAAGLLEKFKIEIHCEWLQKTLNDWISDLKGTDEQTAAVLLHHWREHIIETHVKGEKRARTELGNAMKAAEYRYHNDIGWASFVLAIFESFAVLWLKRCDSGYTDAEVPAFAFFLILGTLLLAPRGTKGLLDAVIGIGARLKP